MSWTYQAPIADMRFVIEQVLEAPRHWVFRAGSLTLTPQVPYSRRRHVSQPTACCPSMRWAMHRVAGSIKRVGCARPKALQPPTASSWRRVGPRCLASQSGAGKAFPC